jgi:transcriptional regulator with XRE-family HTH domain
MLMTRPRPVGDLLREWRTRRRLSQMDLALEAEISTRHLSFLETGRARPSRDMVLRLAEQLEVPLRDRNDLLSAAGFAPAFYERALDDPSLAPARRAIDLVLKGHEPYPALAIDRRWNLVAANRPAGLLLAGIAPVLIEDGPVNVMRAALHPKGLAGRTANLGEWREHLISRLRRQVEISADPVLADLLAEVSAYPVLEEGVHGAEGFGGVAVPFQLRTDGGVLSFLSTTTVFGTPLDITLSELGLECFFPADDATAEALRVMAQGAAMA